MDVRDVIIGSGTTTPVTSSRRKMQFRGKCSGFAETERSTCVYHRYRQAIEISFLSKIARSHLTIILVASYKR
jgi:hypothetical protein